MKSTLIRLVSWLVVLRCFLALGSAAQFVIIARTGSNSWAFYDAETLKINGKDRLRTGSAQKPSLSSDEYKRLNAEQILRIGALRRHAGGYLVRKQGSGWEPVIPDGLNVTGAASYADLWKSAPLTYQADRTGKTISQLRSDEVAFAILPGTDRDQAVTDFLADETNFLGVGEADGTAAFNERMALLVFAAQRLQPPAPRLQQILLSKMTDAMTRVSHGLAHKADLMEGLEYAKVSKTAYPNEPKHIKCRGDLESAKKWLDTRVAILRALAAGEHWDDFLTKYGDFDRWRNSYPDIAQLKEKAFTGSANQHMEMGKQYESTKQWARALSEYKLAQRYLPSDRGLADRIENAKTEDDNGSHKTPPVDMNSVAQTNITKYLSKAKFEIQDRNLDGAEQDITAAQKQDDSSIRVLLARADLLRARKSYQQARELLDEYDREAPTGSQDGIDLRTQVEREYGKHVGELKDAIKKAKADGDYQALVQAASDGAKLDPQDLDFLHDAAIGSAVTRHKKEAVDYQKDYIARLALTPGTTDPQISAAYEEQALLSTTYAEPQGIASWFSGYKSAPGVFYCPISLMPSAHIKEIKSGRQTTIFQWNGDQLLEVDRTGSEPPEKDIKLWFDYRKEQKGVWRAAETKPDSKDDKPSHFLFNPTGTLPAPPSPTPSGKPSWIYFTLLNHPDVDPLMVERLMNKQVAILVSGNPYFHPFEWNGVYRFLAVYDEQGRVKSADYLPNDPADTARYKYEFTWNGPLLEKISGTDYQRQMKYDGDKLISETVTMRGRSAEIRYTWVNGRLVSAKSGEDATGKSRDVVFQ